METGSRRQDLLDRLSEYNYITPYRHAFLKRHGATTDWLTKSTEFISWKNDPKSSIFMLSGKGEPLFGSILHILLIDLVSWVWQDRYYVWTPLFHLI